MLEQTIVALSIFDGCNGQKSFVRLSIAGIETQLGTATVDDVINNLVAVLVGVVKVPLVGFFVRCDDFLFQRLGAYIHNRIFVIESHLDSPGSELVDVVPHALNLEPQNSTVVNGFFDGVLVQTLTVKLLCGACQVALLRAFVFSKDRSSGEAVPQALREEFLNETFGFRGDGAVAFVHHKGNVFDLNLCGKILVLLGRRIFCAPANDCLQFLDGRDNRVPVFACQFLFQVSRFIGVLNVDVVTVGVRLK